MGSRIPFGGGDYMRLQRDWQGNCSKLHLSYQVRVYVHVYRRAWFPVLLTGGQGRWLGAGEHARERHRGGFLQKRCTQEKGVCDTGTLEMIVLHQKGVNLSRRW